jgi:hypothetical protein
MFLQIIRAHNGLNSSQHRWAFYLPVQVQILHIFTASLHVEKTNSSMTFRMALSTDNETKQVPGQCAQAPVWYSSASSFPRSVVILACVMVG